MPAENKLCLKCNYRGTPSDHAAPDCACAKCGAVYAKVEAALRAQAAPAPAAPPTRQRPPAPTRSAGRPEPGAPGDADFTRALQARAARGTRLAHAVYTLYLVGLLLPLTWIVGVIVAHVARSPDNEGWLESHYSWQIRTFWYGLAIGTGLSVLLFGLAPLLLRGVFGGSASTLVAAVLGSRVLFGTLALLGLWLLYRLVFGWVFLFQARTI